MRCFRPVIFAIALAILAAVALPAGASVKSLRVSGGLDRVVIPNAPALNPGGAITIEAWVKQTSTAGCQTIVGKNYLSGYWLGLCSGRIRYYHSGSAGFGDGVAVATIGEWTHIAVTYDRSTKNLYMNGVLDRSFGESDPLPVNLDSIGIGGEATNTCGNTCPFLGDIAEVRIWDTARSRDDIRRDISKQLENPRDGLVAVWHLDGAPDEAFGNFGGATDGGATFFGSAAPAVGEDPLQVPRVSGVVVDGQCNSTNGPLRIPVWDDSPFGEIEWLYIGATSSNLYVCMENMPRAGGFVAIYADPHNDAGLYANPDDFRLRLPESGELVSEAGTGSGGYAGPGPTTSAAEQELGNEFEWSAEFRISRSSLEQAPDEIFRLQVIDDQDGGSSTSGDWGWPVDYFWDWPDFYEPVRIDESALLPSDFQNPMAEAWHEPDVPMEGIVDLNVLGSDDYGVASITIYLDFAEVFSCTFSEVDPTEGCDVQLPLEAGLHHLYGEVTDFARRTTISNIDSFRVVVDGRAPEFLVSFDPFEAPLDGSTTMTVTATDASGIEFIDIDSFRCSFSGVNTEESCTREISAAAGQRVRAVILRAIDSEGLETVATRRVLFGNDGPDGDGDGLSDDIESALCTSPLRPDTDDDSLSDKWEVLGLYFPVSGDYVDLPGLGANPCHKDAFLQYDYEVGARVEAGVIQNIIQAYARNGVTLHVTENERPRPTGDPVSPFGGVEGGIRIDENGDYYFPPKFNWTHVYAYGRHAKGSSGHYEGFFNYDIYAGGTDDCACPLTGIDPADCGTSRESTTNCVRESADGQTRRFMHELGHMLGLGHGGRKNNAALATMIGDYLFYEGERDDENHKPNYRSLMNYAYGGNVCLRPGSNFVGDLIASYDYSKDILPSLNESNLDERATGPMASLMADISCPMAVAGAEPILFHTCADPDEDDSLDLDLNARRSLMVSNGAEHKWRYMHGGTWQKSGWNAPAADGIDWDCDGLIESSVSSNLNGNQGGNARPLPPDDEVCGDGMDTNGDGRGDGADCNWNVSGSGNLLLPNRDWDDFPRAEPCVIPYRGSLLCYFQPADYRAQIEIDDSRLDCRPSLAPAGDCPIPPGGRGNQRGGLAEDYEIENDFFELPPNTEVCDGLDNDGDLDIDEGCLDTDADGLADDTDNCPTEANADQADVDGDALGDACDGLVMGPVAISVQGDIALQIDWDEVPGAIGYNVYKSTDGGEYAYQSVVTDDYPSTTSAFFLDSPPLPGQLLNWQYRVYPVDAHGVEGEPAEGAFSTDDDLDGIDNASDNCLLVANPNQADTDGDGHGNRCDGDFDQSCGPVNFSDLGLMADAFFTPDALFDLDGSGGVVNFADLSILAELFFLPPGPSAPGALCGARTSIVYR